MIKVFMIVYMCMSPLVENGNCEFLAQTEWSEGMYSCQMDRLPLGSVMQRKLEPGWYIYTDCVWWEDGEWSKVK